MLRDHSNKWKQKHTSFWWKLLCTNHKMPHSFTLIVLLRENELFQRGLCHTCGNSGGVGGPSVPCKKWKIQGGGGSWVKFPPWWGSGYFLELHNVGRIADFVDWNVQHDTGTLVQESSFFSKTAFRTKFNLYNWNLWIILIYKDTSSAQIYCG